MISNHVIMTAGSVGSQPSRENSNTLEIAFLSVGGNTVYVGSLPVVETGGHFDFGNKKLTNIASSFSAGDAVNRQELLDAVAGVSLTASLGIQIDSNDIRPVFEPSNATLYVNSGALAVKYDNTSGLTANSAGLALNVDPLFSFSSGALSLNVDSARGLSVVSNQLGLNVSPLFNFSSGALILNVDTARGLSVVADALGVNVGNGLQFVTNALVPKFKDASLNADSDGLFAVVDPAGAILSGVGGLSVNTGDGITISSNAVTAVAGDETIRVDSGGIKQRFDKDFINGDASTILAGQVGYVDSFGSVKLAKASTVGLGQGTMFVVAVADTPATSTSGFYFRRGAIITTSVTLVPNTPVYLDTTDGGITQDISGFTGADKPVRLGLALTASTWILDPVYLGSVGPIYKNYDIPALATAVTEVVVTDIDVNAVFTADSLVEVLLAGRERLEGVGNDWNRDVANQKIVFNETIPAGIWFRVRIYG